MYEITSPDELGRLLYFAQGDSHLRTFMPRKNSLISDLATRLMLEPEVVIPDSFFTTSAEIANDLKKDNRSFVWHGLKRKLIVPAFREKSVESFVDNHDRGVVPTTSIGVRKDARTIAVNLDAAIDGESTPKITWPDGVGISFGKLMDEQFRREAIDSALWGDKGVALWKRSADLRNRYLDMGWQSEKDPKITGLRRSTLFTVIAADLGFRGDPLDTDKLVASADRRRRSALRAVLLWIDELYNYNQASRFSIKPSFPVATAPGALMMPRLLWPGPGQVSDASDVKPYSHTIRWPSRAMLKSVSPDRLLGLRTDQHGEEYIDSLIKFRQTPSEKNWRILEVAVSGYAEKVCEAVGSEVHTGMETRHFVAANGVTIALTLATAATGGLALAGVAAAGIITLITGALASMYIPVNEIVKKKSPADGELMLTGSSGKRGDVRMDLPTK
jgi:hypothetical protein